MRSSFTTRICGQGSKDVLGDGGGGIRDFSHVPDAEDVVEGVDRVVELGDQLSGFAALK